MSIPVFLRNPDGTSWSGRINYNWTSLRQSKLELHFENNRVPSLDEAYRIYGVSSELQLESNPSYRIDNLDAVYRFLYGASMNELMQTQPSNISVESWVNEPQEWTSAMVSTMNWDLFCLSFYAFLSSKEDFYTKVWENLGAILNILRNEPNTLISALVNARRDADENSISDFWKTICNGLSVKIRDWFREDSCYTAFHSLDAVGALLSSDDYERLKNDCCVYLDDIARRRIDAACSNTYTVDELVNFNIESFFFYKEYFALCKNSRETREYVTNAVFTLLHTKGDRIAAANNALGADAVYEAALKYAQTEADKKLIADKCSKISASVIVAKETQHKAQFEQNRKRERAKQKDKATDVIARVLAIVFFVSILTTVVFGLLALFGALLPFSKSAFVVSLCVLIVFVIILAVVSSQEKRK